MNKKRITITVKPNSKKTGIEKISDNQYIVRVNQPPINGKANEAVIEALAELFQLPKSRINILKGKNAKIKIIEISIIT